MISSFRPDETVLITLPGDDADNPTVWEVYPVTARMLAQEESSFQFAASKEREKSLQYTLEVASRVTNMVVDRKHASRAEYIKAIYNSGWNGNDIKGEKEKIAYLDGIPAAQYAELGNVMQDANRLRDLTFRGDHPAGATAGTGEGEEGGAAEP